MLHFVSTLLPHLARLSGVAKVLVLALTAQAMTPLGTWKMVAFHDMSFSSLANRESISPWKAHWLAVSILFSLYRFSTFLLASTMMLGFSTLTVTA